MLKKDISSLISDINEKYLALDDERDNIFDTYNKKKEERQDEIIVIMNLHEIWTITENEMKFKLMLLWTLFNRERLEEEMEIIEETKSYLKSCLDQKISEL